MMISPASGTPRGAAPDNANRQGRDRLWCPAECLRERRDFLSEVEG